jgi:hypothetical protein
MEIRTLLRDPRVKWLLWTIPILIVVGVLWLVPRARSIVNSNSAIASVTLSALLVLLYLGQYRLQSRQLRFQNKPHVDVQRRSADGSTLEVWLSNFGNGVATDIELKSCVEYESDDETVSDCQTRQLKRVGEDGNPKDRIGNSLKAGEDDVRFVGDPVLPVGPGDRGGLVTATRWLAEREVEEATFSFYITNSSLLGQEDEERIFGRPRTIELDPEGMDLEELLDSPGTKEINGHEAAFV